MNYFWIKLIIKGKRNSVFLYTLKSLQEVLRIYIVLCL